MSSLAIVLKLGLEEAKAEGEKVGDHTRASRAATCVCRREHAHTTREWLKRSSAGQRAAIITSLFCGRARTQPTGKQGKELRAFARTQTLIGGHLLFAFTLSFAPRQSFG